MKINANGININIIPTVSQGVKVLNDYKKLYNTIDECFIDLKDGLKKKEYISILESFIKEIVNNIK